MQAAASTPVIRLSKSAILTLLVVLALATSSLAFKEPAPTDAFMGLVIIALPFLAQGRLGPVTTVNLVIWLVLVALGIAVLPISTSFDTAVQHQIVTLFLALGSVALAAYLAQEPERRFHYIMVAYVFASLIASFAAFVGYFGIFGAELFTNFGRARGTFKDPNVLAASLVPALTYCTWMMMRAKTAQALLAGGSALFIALALLLSFSRGAWIATALALMVLLYLALVTAREGRHLVRFVTVSIIGVIGLAGGIGAMLKTEAVSKLFTERASLDQSYDNGPEGRFGGHDKAEQLILDNPFGIGTHTFRTTYHHEEVHNVYLTQFLNAGWLGGLLFILTTGLTLITGFRGALIASPLQGPFIISTTAFAAIAFEGIIIDTDHWRFLFMLMGLVWGLSDAAFLKTHLQDEDIE